MSGQAVALVDAELLGLDDDVLLAHRHPNLGHEFQETATRRVYVGRGNGTVTAVAGPFSRSRHLPAALATAKSAYDASS